MYSEDKADLEYVYGKEDKNSGYLEVKIYKEDFIFLLNKIETAYNKLNKIEEVLDCNIEGAPCNILLDGIENFLYHLFYNKEWAVDKNAIFYYIWVIIFGRKKNLAKDKKYIINGKNTTLTCADDLWKILIEERE